MVRCQLLVVVMVGVAVNDVGGKGTHVFCATKSLFYMDLQSYKTYGLSICKLLMDCQSVSYNFFLTFLKICFIVFAI